MKKLFSLVSVILIFVIGLAGCSSKNASLELVNKYYDNIKNNNFDESYAYLSNASTNIWTKEDYEEWESMQSESFTLKDVKIEKTNEYINKDLDDIKYLDVVEYNITESYYDNFREKDANSTFAIYAVNENNQWKIYMGKEDSKEQISKSKCTLASMYFTGRGENKDIDKAQEILNQSIEENPDYRDSYYVLGCMYIYLGKYDESISIGEQNIDKTKTKEEKSDLYYMMGWAYEGKKDGIKAKNYYTQSLEANPNNENAKTSLTKLNSESE